MCTRRARIVQQAGKWLQVMQKAPALMDVTPQRVAARMIELSRVLPGADLSVVILARPRLLVDEVCTTPLATPAPLPRSHKLCDCVAARTKHLYQRAGRRRRGGQGGRDDAKGHAARGHAARTRRQVGSVVHLSVAARQPLEHRGGGAGAAGAREGHGE